MLFINFKDAVSMINQGDNLKDKQTDRRFLFILTENLTRYDAKCLVFPWCRLDFGRIMIYDVK